MFDMIHKYDTDFYGLSLYNHGLTTPIKSIPIKAICADTYMANFQCRHIGAISVPPLAKPMGLACPCSEYSSHTVFH